jgi:hypothetical protein
MAASCRSGASSSPRTPAAPSRVPCAATCSGVPAPTAEFVAGHMQNRGVIISCSRAAGAHQ